MVAIELGDGVAPHNKELDRKEAARTIEQVDFCYKEVALKVNRISALYDFADI